MIQSKKIKDHTCDKELGGSIGYLNHPILLMVLTLFLLSGFLFSGCAHHIPIATDTKQALYIAEENGADPLLRFAPIFRVYDYQHPYNRIGRPIARKDDNNREQISIDTGQPTYFVEKKSFATSQGTYTNLIYRVHFPSIPYSIVPFNLTAGKNAGLIIVITLDSDEEPVLVTSVHTCGCYKALVATTALPEDALPPKRRKITEHFRVYGEELPPVLDYRNKAHPRLLVDLRPGVHRVMDLEVIDAQSLKSIPFDGTILTVATAPSEDLKRLNLNGHETSFYRQDGWMKDHVKGAIKPLETLLMSWLSLDLFIGTDKVYGSDDNPFYTSLKPWNRRKSDMNDFARFLDFWGWGL